MVDAKKLLGALLDRGMTNSSQRRIETSLGEATLSDILDREFGAMPQKGPAQKTPATPSKSPTRVPVGAPSSSSKYAPPGSPKHDLPASNKYDPPGSPKYDPPTGRSGSDKPNAGSRGPGGLGSMFGDSFKGAMGAGALALLGAIAMRALRGKSAASQPDSAARLVSGLREPENPQEEQQVQSLAELIVKAMLNAAKSDGVIDEDELQKVVGELQSGGVTQAERDFLLAEARKPMSTAEIVREVHNPQVAAQVYAASLLAIEVDTPAEREYLQQLAGDLGLDSQVAGQIEAELGVKPASAAAKPRSLGPEQSF